MLRAMPKPKQRTVDNPAQSKRFIEAAREAEAEETEEGADRAFTKVARAKSDVDQEKKP